MKSFAAALPPPALRGGSAPVPAPGRVIVRAAPTARTRRRETTTVLTQLPARAPLPVRRGLTLLAAAAAAWGTTGATVDLVYRSTDLGPSAVSFWRCGASGCSSAPASG
jgi:hypothetical protein